MGGITDMEKKMWKKTEEYSRGEKDILMLTLYKQHYRDEYGKDSSLKCDYSCWGYYDGMSLKKIEGQKSGLFEKQSDSPISDLWYQDAEETGEMNGRYGVQNIGLFRYGQDNESRERGDRFWEENGHMPYMMVGFLQMKPPNGNDTYDHYEFCSNLEIRYDDDPDMQTTKRCQVLFYDTFDNADLVVLIHGNSIWELEETAEKIQDTSAVVYMHCISGVREEYISADVNIMDNYWNGIICNVKEKLDEIMINVASAGGTAIEKLEKKIGEIFDSAKIEYARATGHANITFYISGARVSDLLQMIREGGIASHQGDLYGDGIYNIETRVIVEKNPVGKPDGEWQVNEGSGDPGWCGKMITWCRQKFREAKGLNDESLYSYYQSLIQTLNILGQYENFGQARKIFYELYPSFQLFFKQLEKALEALQDIKEEGDREKALDGIKESMCQYLEAVNAVMYHTTHTDQMFLMIPGYSGGTYSIPVKLNLFYSWFCDQVVNILNDDEYEYQTLLAPAIEAKPVTSVIGFGLGPGDRLILVRASQRLLYMPRDLMIILAHEIGHYSGSTIRCREYRAEMLIHTLASIIQYAVCDTPGNYISDPDMVEALYKKNIYYIEGNIEKELKEDLEENCRDKGYHASDIADRLKAACRAVLANENEGIYKQIYYLDKRMTALMKRDPDKSHENIEELRNYQDMCNANRKQLLVSKNILDAMIDELLTIYREVFSDIAAREILGFSVKDFREAFDISEGHKTERTKEARYLMREMILMELNTKNPEDKTGLEGDSKQGGSGGDGEENDSDRMEMILKSLYSFTSTQDDLKKYAEKCCEQIKERWQQDDVGENVKTLCNMFKMFTTKKNDNGQNITGKDIYNEILENIVNYMNRVEEEKQVLKGM